MTLYHLTPEERDAIMRRAMGRIFRLGSRPFQAGDDVQYEAARRAFLAAYDACPFYVEPDHRPSYARHS